MLKLEEFDCKVAFNKMIQGKTVFIIDFDEKDDRFIYSRFYFWRGLIDSGDKPKILKDAGEQFTEDEFFKVFKNERFTLGPI